jgi:hypothetical protein
MVNPLSAMVAMQLRFYVQWLEAVQTLMRACGVWGQSAQGSPFSPATSAIILPFRRGCVGAADLKGWQGETARPTQS